MHSAQTSDTAAVVVLHGSFDTVSEVVGDLVNEGLLPAAIFIIDNSQDAVAAEALRSNLHRDVRYFDVENRGYGAAVNFGVRRVHAELPNVKFVVVATHEARIRRGHLGALVEYLRHHELTIVAPGLITSRSGRDLVWSEGGYRTTFLGLPRHRGYLAPIDVMPAQGITEVTWADGCFFACSVDTLMTFPMREDFFLYVEEMEQQERVRRAGGRVVVLFALLVEQASNGTPDFYLARNLQLFYTSHGTFWQRAVSVRYLIARSMPKHLVRRGTSGESRRLLAGLKAAKSDRASA